MRPIQAAGDEALGLDLTDPEVDHLQLKKLVKHKDNRVSVAGLAGEIRSYLRRLAVENDGSKTGNGDGHAMNDGHRVQCGMPTRVHHVEKLSALHSIGKLDAGSAGIISRLEIGRLESGCLEAPNRHGGKCDQVGIL